MTAIEWARNPDGSRGKTWNPIRARDAETGRTGWHCEHVHEGCRFCYAERLNLKSGASGGTGLAYKPASLGDADIFLDENALRAPLKWKKPQRIFVCSMTDLFGRWVESAWLDRIFAVAALCPQHTFIVLTKRPARMHNYLIDFRWFGRATVQVNAFELPSLFNGTVYEGKRALSHHVPLPNVWLLVSCSTQDDVDAFVPELLATPAVVHGVSLEPLLGPIHLHEKLGDDWLASGLSGERRGLDWVIAGGESGGSGQLPRPMHPDWVRSLRDQCAAAEVPFFFKQWGDWGPAAQANATAGTVTVCRDGTVREWQKDYPSARLTDPQMASMARVGKKRAGRLLDGVEYSAWPEVRP